MAARCGSLRLPLLPSTPRSASGLLRPAGLRPGRSESTGASSMTGAGRKKRAAVPGVSARARAYLVVEEVQKENKGFNAGAALLALVADAARSVLGVLEAAAAGRRSWALQAEKIVESAIINCRFFTLISVAGTLVGSILCFVEGCSLIVEAYLEYFLALWEKLDQGEVMNLLIEALDMFLVGSAMLNFGMGLYIIFVGSRGSKRYIGLLPRVALNLHEKILPSCMQLQCVSEAKAKLGHAVLTLLQSGVVDKLKGLSLSSGLDLACFAGAILVSSAGVFLLSRLHCSKRASDLEEEELDVS